VLLGHVRRLQQAVRENLEQQRQQADALRALRADISAAGAVGAPAGATGGGGGISPVNSASIGSSRSSSISPRFGSLHKMFQRPSDAEGLLQSRRLLFEEQTRVWVEQQTALEQVDGQRRRVEGQVRSTE
jgi:hypothetical protein